VRRRLAGGRVGIRVRAMASGEAERVKVCVLGVGLMGEKFAGRLASQGHATGAWNRTQGPQSGIAGVTGHSTCAEAVSAADYVVTTLSDAAALTEVLVGDSATRSALAGKVVIQMGTIGPQQSRDLESEVRKAGARAYLEAPVLGSKPEAEKGTLLVMAGGTEEDFDLCLPVLKSLSEDPLLIGPVGQGAATKLALNQLIGAITIGFSTSLGLLQDNDVPVDKFMAILRPSALYAPTMDKKLQRMLDRDYANPNFPTKHLLKDIMLFQDEIDSTGSTVDKRFLKGQEHILAKTLRMGLADTDYSAVHDGVTLNEEP